MCFLRVSHEDYSDPKVGGEQVHIHQINTVITLRTEGELRGISYRAVSLYNRVPRSHVVAELILLSLLLSLRPRPQQCISDNHTTTTTTLFDILDKITVSVIVINILPIAQLELTRLYSLLYGPNLLRKELTELTFLLPALSVVS